MSWNCICETVYRTLRQVADSIQQQSTQVCDNEDCYEPSQHSLPTSTQSNTPSSLGNLFLMLFLLLAIFGFLSLMTRNGRPSTTAKPMARNTERERDTTM